MRIPAVLFAVAGAAAFALTGRPAAAQPTVRGIALNQLEPAPAGDLLFGVPSPSAAGHLVPRAVVVFDHADKPLRLVRSSGETPIVASQSFLRLDASLALWDRLLISVDMPIAILQSGEDPPGAGVSFDPPSGPAAGDLRVGARVRLFGGDASPIQAGLGGYFFVPTGPSGSYTGEGAVRGAAHAALGGRIDAPIVFMWSAAIGATLRGSENPHVLTFGAGAAALFWKERIQIGPEVYGSTTLSETTLVSGEGVNVAAPAGTSAELLLGARVRPLMSLVLGAAAGPGLTTGLGTPTFRVVALAGWSPRPTLPGERVKPVAGDRDGDGFGDDIDACPDVKGELVGDPAKDGCPPADRDGDRILDTDDACPSHPGLRTGDSTTNGCPKDSDGDGLHDAIDVCPSERGLRTDDEKRSGCPSDKDGDGVPDEFDACPGDRGIEAADPRRRGCPEDKDGDGVKLAGDACPNERGAASADPSESGCPKFVRVTADEIVLRKPIELKLSIAERGEIVDPGSEDVLAEVRDVIAQHPELLKIEVQAHTDDSGDPKFNLRISEERAQIVLRRLLAAGVPAEKLVAKGYGHTRPIADNRHPEGRKKNRRISFLIAEKTK